MATIEERYQSATAYVRRAISVVERGPGIDDSLTASIEAYAGRLKTSVVRGDLERIEARWLRAATAFERARLARDAELLADRTQESLPGAPQDRKRTNLFPGETPSSTPSTSFEREVDSQAGFVWSWLKQRGSAAAGTVAAVSRLVVVGGVAFVGYELYRLARARHRAQTRNSRRALNAALVDAAERRE